MPKIGRVRGWLRGVGLVLSLAGLGGIRPAAGANPFGLVLELKQPGPASVIALAVVAPVELEMPRAFGPAVEAEPAGGLTGIPVEEPAAEPSAWEPHGIERPERGPLVRSEQLRWFLLGGTIVSLWDRQLLRQFDPDIHEPGAQRDPMAKRISALGTGLPLFVAIGTPYLVDGSHGRKSTRLALAAMVDAVMITQALKFITGKERPFQSDGGIRFHGPGSGFSSFPSGHTSASFAVATVLGSRYPRYRTLLLGLATAVGLSRMSTASHFPSDVFVGAGIGTYTGRRAIATDGRLLGLGFRF
jgi:membrane-associated phospholipid phosphatase